MSTTRQILKALRDSGLTARSGCNRPTERYQVEVLDAKVVNVCACSELGLGCWNDPRWAEVVDSLAERVSAVLTSLGVEHRRVTPAGARPTDQFLINGYRAG
jgi:hypothetical protein